MKTKSDSITSVIQIAYADDQVMVRKGMIELIRHFPQYRVNIEAADGRELIDKILAAKDLPDICIVDISMRGMNGFETVSEIKKLWPSMKILVLTMHELEHYMIRMFRQGVNGYLLKNADPSELNIALQSICEDGFYSSDYSILLKIENKSINFPDLTAREYQALKHLCSDLTIPEIAKKLNTTDRSIKGYRDSMYRKFNVHHRSSLVLLAVQLGFIPLNNFTFH